MFFVGNPRRGFPERQMLTETLNLIIFQNYYELKAIIELMLIYCIKGDFINGEAWKK